MKSKGFALVDLAIALAIFGIVTSVLALNLFKEQKQEVAKEIASTLIAIDQGFYTLALSQQLIHTYRGESEPIPFPTLTSSETDETDYVEEVLKKSYGRDLQNFSDKGISLIDPRIDLKKLAKKGYTFTFNVVNGYTLASITVNGIDNEINNYLSNILGNKWNKQRKTFRLNDGKGYIFTPVQIKAVVSYRNVPYRECWISVAWRKCSDVWRQVPVWGDVLIGYRLVAGTSLIDEVIDTGEIPIDPEANNFTYDLEKLEPVLREIVESALERSDESILYSASLIVDDITITSVRVTTREGNVQIVNLSERNLASLLLDDSVVYIERPYTVIKGVQSCRLLNPGTTLRICGKCKISHLGDELYIFQASCSRFSTYECTTISGDVFHINTLQCNPLNTNFTN